MVLRQRQAFLCRLLMVALSKMDFKGYATACIHPLGVKSVAVRKTPPQLHPSHVNMRLSMPAHAAKHVQMA